MWGPNQREQQQQKACSTFRYMVANGDVRVLRHYIATFLHSPTFFLSDKPTRRLLFRFIQQAVYKIMTFNKIRDNINSGNTVRDGEWSVGKGELLTLTRSCPSNRKRYNIKSSLISQTKVSSPKPRTNFDNFYLKIERKQ